MASTKKARTRGFASLTLVRFAFVVGEFSQNADSGQFWDVLIDPVIG